MNPMIVPSMLIAAACTSLPSGERQQEERRQEERQQEGGIMGPYVGRVRTDGPATICGTAFAIRLSAGESAQRQEGPDFDLFYVSAADGDFLLYEGNYPQAYDDAIQTGRSFPSVVAIHDSRGAEARARGPVRDRLITGPAQAEACPRQSNNQ